MVGADHVDRDHLEDNVEKLLSRAELRLTMPEADKAKAFCACWTRKEAFIKAEKNARTIEELNRILDLAKKHIGQKTAISMLGI